ncbi:MAG: hypothetical protein GXY52_09610 [Chloroflexi bacterium]|nr:hypothetical protein [Chloroflexota bacterium]
MPEPLLTSQLGAPPPDWALMERALITEMNTNALRYQEHYTRRDGSFIWRDEWPGFDGSDDGYESYHNWPLFYALGGDSELHERSRWLWETVTRQFTEYGQVYREFDANYDWMHHGESSIYLYYFGLADPTRARDRARTLRFARMYMGEDPLAPNWDADKRMMRSPITGSRGPRLVNTWDDWATHRAVLALYPPPFDDLPGVPGPLANWNDDQVYSTILQALNARMMRCDVPLNLTSTSLITHAYLYTGDDKYRTWVLDYLQVWAERIQANGGICPDNVGPNGVVGETNDGKWWGGYYGWRWPHGFMTIIQPLTIAAMNAVLLTGDQSYLDIPRGQIDRIIELGHVEGEALMVPNRHLDSGWADFRQLRPEYPLQIWFMSQDERDRARLERFPERLTEWSKVAPGRGKGDDIHIAPYYRFLEGANPGYPQALLDAQWNEVARRMARMASDDSDPESWDVHHWQDINPVHTEALLQLTCGGPQIIYHGGLLHVRLRYYDAIAARPGLPPDVGALVTGLDGSSIRVRIANISTLEPRELLIQAGAFGEHRFTSVQDLAAGESAPQDAGKYVRVRLAPGGQVELQLNMQRYVNKPSYEQPVFGSRA